MTLITERPMKYIDPLSEFELSTLMTMHKNHKSSRVRKRAHIIMLSSKGYQIKDIAAICQVTRQSVSSYIDSWARFGLAGMYDKPRSGRPRSLTPEDEEFVKERVQQEPRSVKKIIAVLEDQRGKRVSQSTIKRTLKKKQN